MADHISIQTARVPSRDDKELTTCDPLPHDIERDSPNETAKKSQKSYDQPPRVEDASESSNSEILEVATVNTDSTESRSSRSSTGLVRRTFRYLKYKVHSMALKRKSTLDRENYLRTITIAYVPDGRNQENSRVVRAQFDTACRRNLISRRVADELGFAASENIKKIVIGGLGGGEFATEGTLKGRWVMEENSCTIMGFKIRDMRKFENDSFEVCPDDWFDVIIGLRTMRRLRYTPGIPSLAAPSRRLEPSNAIAGKADREKCKKARDDNAALKKAHRQVQKEAPSNENNTAQPS